MSEWKLVIHGGAGAMRPVHGDEDHVERARRGLRDALDAGSTVLGGDGSAIDAVEAAVRVLEDDPCFNAGRGSTLNAEGLVELDAAIMDGARRRAGAVAGVRTTRAPISPVIVGAAAHSVEPRNITPRPIPRIRRRPNRSASAPASSKSAATVSR